jgi:hypothetical protein
LPLINAAIDPDQNRDVVVISIRVPAVRSTHRMIFAAGFMSLDSSRLIHAPIGR